MQVHPIRNKFIKESTKVYVDKNGKETNKMTNHCKIVKKQAPNTYWQGYMDDDGVNTMYGYDEAVKAVESLFNDLPLEITQSTPLTEYDIYSEYLDMPYDEIAEEDIENMPDKVKILVILKGYLLEQLENNRNFMGTALLDESTKYSWIKTMVDTGKRKNYLTELD